MSLTKKLALLAAAACLGVAVWVFVTAPNGGEAPVAPTASARDSTSLGLWLLEAQGPKLESDVAGATEFNAHASAGSFLKIQGEVRAETQNNAISRLVVPLAVRGDQNNIALPGESGTLSVEVAWSETASAVIPATYTLRRLEADRTALFSPGEQAELTIELPATPPIRPEHSVDLVIRTANGERLVIQDVRVE